MIVIIYEQNVKLIWLKIIFACNYCNGKLCKYQHCVI